MKRALDDVLAAAAAHQSGREQPWLVGSPFFPPPPELLAALRRAASGDRFDYAPQWGLEELRRSICEQLDGEGLAVGHDQVVATHGSKGGLLALFANLLQPGDEVLHPIPAYPAYPTIARQFGATAVGIPEKEAGFSWTEDELERYCGPRTRILVISSPSNPSGTTLRADEAQRLIDFCRKRSLQLVLDEAYEAFRFDDEAESPARFDPRLETIALLRSYSKSLAVCGWRVGWLAAEKSLVTKVASWQSAMLNPPSSLAQIALSEASEAPGSYRKTMRSVVAGRLAELAALVSSLGVPVQRPAGGFYLWVDLRDRLSEMHHTSASFCVALAERSGLALWPGEDYGAPGWVRLSGVACKEQDWAAECRRLREALAAHLRKDNS